MRLCVGISNVNVCVWVIYYMTALTYQKPIRCSPKTYTIWSRFFYSLISFAGQEPPEPSHHHWVVDLRQSHWMSLHPAQLLRHGEHHHQPWSAPGNHLQLQLPTILWEDTAERWTVSLRLLVQQLRLRLPQARQRTLLHGRSQVSNKEDTLIPLKKFPPNSLSSSSSLPGAYSKGAASRRPASSGSTWRGRVVVPMRTIRCIINRIPTTHAVCRKPRVCSTLWAPA